MDPVSTALITKALEGLNQRAMATSQNIANANSPGYQAVHVHFEESLRLAAGRDVAAIDAVEPQITTEESAGEMRLDLELATASQTAMRYRALLEILGRQMALERAVVSGSAGR